MITLPVWFDPWKEMYEYGLDFRGKLFIRRIHYAGSETSYIGCWKFETSKDYFGCFVIEFLAGKYFYCEVPIEDIGKRYVDHVASRRTMGLAPHVTLVEGLPRFFQRI